MLFAPTSATGMLCSKSGFSTHLGRSRPSAVTYVTWGSTITLNRSRTAELSTPANRALPTPLTPTA